MDGSHVEYGARTDQCTIADTGGEPFDTLQGLRRIQRDFDDSYSCVDERLADLDDLPGQNAPQDGNHGGRVLR
jgi:hypothetical protein